MRVHKVCFAYLDDVLFPCELRQTRNHCLSQDNKTAAFVLGSFLLLVGACGTRCTSARVGTRGNGLESAISPNLSARHSY